MTTTILEKMLEPATSQMPPSFARKILQLRADGEVLSRIEFLRSRADSGLLTEIEAQEYQEIVEAIDIISLLQHQARKVLDAGSE